MSSSSALELAAPAKLNLFLEVLGRRPDGYHEIDTVLTTIDLADRVRLERATRISLTVEGEAAPADSTNLAWRAAAALGVGARIHLEKRIPAGSGLGGGSSDAAAVLLGLDRLYDLRTPPARLHELAAGLGADVPFFLLGPGLARGRGIGDRLEPLPPRPPMRFHLVLPPLHVSTAEVYGALGPGLTENREIAKFLAEKNYRREEPGRATHFNRLQSVAEGLEPRLSQVRRAAEARFGVPFTLTGSGSAYFGEAAGKAAGERFEVGRCGTVRALLVETTGT